MIPEETPDATDRQRGRLRGTGLRGKVARELAERILSGIYPQTKPIPVEAVLMAEFNVSRTVLREAVRTLVAKGLLETRQGTGTMVLLRSDWHLLDPDVLSWMGGIELDGKFVMDITEARKVIEPAAAAFAALTCSARSLASIEEAYEAMCAAAVDDLDASIRADLDFHQAILRASGNIVFANLGEAVGAGLLAVFQLTTNASENYAKTLDAHGSVLEAIRMRQPDIAREKMSGLLEIASADLRRTLNQKPKGSD